MGNAKFYYTPEPFGAGPRLQVIDLGEALGEMYSDISIEAVDAVSLTGSIQRSVGRTQEIVTIQRDRMIGGEDLAIQFHALQNHLDRGFSVSFAADDTNAFCFPIRGSLSNGSNSLNLYANPFSNFTGISAIPATGDYCTIETSSPAMIQEIVKVDNASAVTAQGGTITTVDLIKFQYDQPAFLRHYRFYPVLKRPQSDIGQSIITNEGGRLFSLSIRLVVDYEVLYAAHPDTIGESGVSFGRSLASATTGGGQGAGITLDGLTRSMPHHLRDIASVEVGGIPTPEALGGY
jgi:hypothetical protein